MDIPLTIISENTEVGMKQLFDDLWQTETYITGPLSTHSYFLKTDKGNVLIYSTSHHYELDEIEKLGGITHQLISHRDEMSSILVDIKKRFNSKLLCDAQEADSIGKYCRPDILVEDSLNMECGIKVFHSPGHSIGSCTFWYESPTGKKYLFTGDSFFPWNGKLRTFVISGFGGTNQAMKETLEVYKQYEPDMVLCSAAIGDVHIMEMTKDSWSTAINESITRLE